MSDLFILFVPCKWIIFSYIVTHDFIFIVMQEGSVFFCSVECGKASWISLKREQLAVLKIKGAICICIEPFKINATVKVHSTWFNMIGFLRYIICWFCIQSVTKLLRLKWSNFEEQIGFPEKWRPEKEWRNSILMICRYPRRSDLGSTFDSWQVEANFPHGVTNL